MSSENGNAEGSDPGTYTKSGSSEIRWVSVRVCGLAGGSRDCPPYHINPNTQRQDSKSLLGTNQHIHFCIFKYITLHHYKMAAAAPDFQFSSVHSLSRVRFCNPMNLSTPGLPVHHQLPEFTQTHVHRVSDAIQPSHPLSSPYPPALNLSQHQGLLKEVSSLHQVAKVLEFQLQSQSFQ